MSATREYDWGDLDEEDERATYWKPNIGDVLRGTLEGLELVPDKYNADRKSMLLLIRDENGALWNWFAPTSARRTISERFAAGVIAIGGPFGAKRREDVDTRNGKMKTFTIVPRPSRENAQEKARRAVEEERTAAAGDEGQLDFLPKKEAPRGAQEVKSRTVNHPADSFEDEVPF